MKASHRIAGIVAVVAATIALIAFSLWYDWFPTLIASEDGKIDDVYKALLVASIPFFVIICAFMAFCVVEFRAKPGDPDDLDGEPLHGSTRLEIVWTLVPTVVVLALGIYAWMVLNDIEAKKPNELKINVAGQQFIWNYEYPDYKIKTSKELVVPINQPLYFTMTSKDVMHSFFVPNARLKRDVAEGYKTHIRFTPDKLGTYPIVCTELCGIGHAVMRSTLRVVPVDEFKKWVAEQGGGGAKKAGAPTGIDGKSVFASAGCAGCHTLADANATGKAGPDLDKIGTKGAAFVRESIVKPDAYVEKGFQKGIMPPTYGEDLSPEELKALVDYLVKVGK
jgi:cytochrome c oxidase subunit 2